MTTEYDKQQAGIKALKSRIRELEEEVTVLVTELGKLQKDSEKLAALEAAGVDNWEWYGEAVSPLYEDEEDE